MDVQKHQLGRKVGIVFLTLLSFLLLVDFALADTISYDDFECNGFSCGTGWNGAWSSTGTCTITTLSSPQGTYMMRAETSCIATRNFNNLDYGTSTVSFWATATSLEASDYCRYYYFDGTTYHQLLQLADGQDTGTLQYYTYDISSYGLNANAGIRIQQVGSTGDYCYIDTITTSGTLTPPSLNIYMDPQYPVSQQNVEVTMSSNVGNTGYTLQLFNSTGGKFCEKTATSPATPNTPFSVTCNLPGEAQNNAYAHMFQTSNPSISQTDYFNIITPIHDSVQLSIDRVYFSPQILQGSSTEIFALVDSVNPLTALYLTILFPDNSTRRLSMEPTINAGEYRGFITDTYQKFFTNFTIRAESGVYYDEYSNMYYVVPVTIDYVNQVGNVSVVNKLNEIRIDVFGTEYVGGDNGKLFLQLLDGDRQAVTNSECFLSVWYPDGTRFLNNTLMSHLEEGIYYRNFLVPNIEGVFPAAARCYVPLDFANLYEADWAAETFGTNSWTGGTGHWSTCDGEPNCQDGWDYEDTVPLASIVSSGCYQGTYCAEIKGSYGYIERGVDVPTETHKINITYHAKITGAQTNEHFDFYIFDGNWHLIKQYGVSPTYGSYSNDVWTKQNFLLDESAFEFGPGFLIGWYATKETPSTSDRFYVDDIHFDIIAPNISIGNDTQYQILMGAGEVHVSKLYSLLNSSITSATAKVDELLRIANSTKTQAQFITSQTYNLNDTGIVATRLTYSNGDFEYAETGATCNIVTRGPANASGSPSYGPVVYNTTMSSLGDGTYYYSFIPMQLGIYNSEVTCTAGTEETLRTYNAITQYRVEDDITSISIEGLSNLIEEMNLAFFNYESNVTPYTVGGIYRDYLNESVYMIFSGTEYNSGEQGFIGMQILKTVAQGGNEPINDLSCNSTIWYPNFAGIYVSSLMSNTQNIYYHNFTVPSTEGVYADAVVCTQPISGKTYYGMHTFHVAPWANKIHNISSAIEQLRQEMNLSFNNVLSEIAVMQIKLDQIKTQSDFLEQFTAEQVHLITDSVVELQKTGKAVETGIITNDEATVQVKEVKANLLSAGIQWAPEAPNVLIENIKEVIANKYAVRLVYTDPKTGEVRDSFQLPKISIYNPNGDKVITNADMNRDQAGVYSYQLDPGEMSGDWTTEIELVKDDGQVIRKADTWMYSNTDKLKESINKGYILVPAILIIVIVGSVFSINAITTKIKTKNKSKEESKT